MNAVKRRARQLLLLAALVLSVWAAWQVSRDEVGGSPAARAGQAVDGVRRPVSDPRRTSEQALVVANPIRLPERADPAGSVLDFFAPPLQRKAASPVVAKPVASAPVAPPLPYIYLGRIEEGGQTLVFLMDGGKELLVAPGSAVSKGWRLDSVSTGKLEFTFEPLNQQLILRLGAD